jgi:glycosyltransferase involved in cell wall biosynthesis
LGEDAEDRPLKKLLIVSNDEVGAQMAGPGIRYYHFAGELAKRFDVTLVVPTLPESARGDFEILQASQWRGRRFRSLARGSDAVVAQTLQAWTMRELGRADVRVVYDLYDPIPIANLTFHAGEDVSEPYRRAAFRALGLRQEIALATGDSFVCASERQRDLWLGLLAAVGRINPQTAEVDPDFRNLVDIVPFGLETEPPVATRPALKGVVPGIRADDKVLLWGGGIWNWLDPLTPIRAVHALSRKRDDVKLFFLGVRHPNPGVHQLAMTTRAVELADELGVRDRFVFFNFGWVPYAERADYLLDADLGISSHLDTIETRFAFRTRLLDYFWAGLPTVATKGDVLSELVAGANLGRTVEVLDVGDWTRAIEELLDDRDEYARVQANIEREREAFFWPRVIEPLARLAGLPRGEVETRRSATTLSVQHNALALEAVLLRHGLVGGARDVVRILRRPPVP